MNSEKPEADLAEQIRQADESLDEEEPPTAPLEVAPDVDPADLADQQRIVPEDDAYDRG